MADVAIEKRLDGLPQVGELVGAQGPSGVRSSFGTMPNRPMPASAHVRVTPSMRVLHARATSGSIPHRKPAQYSANCAWSGSAKPGCVVVGQEYQDGPDWGKDDSREQSQALASHDRVVGRLHDSGRRDGGEEWSHGRLTTLTEVSVSRSWSAICAALGRAHRAARSVRESGGDEQPRHGVGVL